MNAKHKILFTLELIVFAVPVYVLYLSYGLFALSRSILGQTIGNPIIETVFGIFVFICLFVFARLTFEILFRRDISLIYEREKHWRIIQAALIYTIIGGAVSIWLYNLTGTPDQQPNNFSLEIYAIAYSASKWALFGLPMMVPAMHILLLKKFKIGVTEIQTNDNSQ